MQQDNEYIYNITIPAKLGELPFEKVGTFFSAIISECKKVAPVRTGNLRRSLHMNPYEIKNGILQLYVDTGYFMRSEPYYKYTNEKKCRCQGWWRTFCKAVQNTVASKGLCDRFSIDEWHEQGGEEQVAPYQEEQAKELPKPETETKASALKSIERKQLTIKSVEEMDANIIIAILVEGLGEKIAIKETPTAQELVQEKKKLADLRKKYINRTINGVAVVAIIRILIDKLSENAKLRKEIK